MDSNSFNQLLDRLEVAYNGGSYLTSISDDVIVSVNPVEPTNNEQNRETLKNLVQSLLGNKTNTVIALGESGSGKTEFVKSLLRQLGTYVIDPGFVPSLEHAHIVLESLGNCETPNNSNSSRFIKSTTLSLLHNNLVDVRIGYGQLIKGTLIAVPQFHIFHAMRSDEEIRSKYNLLMPSRTPPYSWEQFNGSCKFLQIDNTSIIRNLALIEYLGSIQFVQVDSEIQLRSNYFRELNHHFGLTIESLTSLFTRIHVRDTYRSRCLADTITLKKNLIYYIYEICLTDMLTSVNEAIARIKLLNNVTASRTEFDNVEINKIHLIDIYGFETSKPALSDQFNINYVNEAFSYNFLKLFVHSRADDIKSDGIQDFTQALSSYVNSIASLFGDASNRLRFIEGIITITKDLKLIPGNNNVKALSSAILRLKHSIGSKSMSVSHDQLHLDHFSARVTYSLAGLLEEHFVLKKDFKAQINLLLNRPIDAISPEINNYATLMTDVSNLLVDSKARFTICVKPNRLCSPNDFDWGYVAHSLKSASIDAYVRLEEDFPFRSIPFSKVFAPLGNSILMDYPANYDNVRYLETVKYRLMANFIVKDLSHIRPLIVGSASLYHGKDVNPSEILLYDLAYIVKRVIGRYKTILLTVCKLVICLRRARRKLKAAIVIQKAWRLYRRRNICTPKELAQWRAKALRDNHLRRLRFNRSVQI